MQLTDLPYIKKRTQLRLNNVGIHTALEFYRASYWVLFRQVFKSVMGHHWYLKLRGYETEQQYGIKTIGRNYVLENRTSDPQLLSDLLQKASLKVGRRLLQKGFSCRGLMLGLRYQRKPSSSYFTGSNYRPSHWFARRIWPTTVHRADQLHERAMALFSQSPSGLVVVGFDLTSYALQPRLDDQPPLFEDNYGKRERLESSIHAINNRYGELTVAPASVALRPQNPMKDKVPFGTVRYFE